MNFDRLMGLLVLCSLLPPGTVQGQPEAPRPDYRNPALPTAQRVEDLLARMTLKEKVAQMLCLWNAKKEITDAQGRFDDPMPRRGSGWGSAGSSARAMATDRVRRRSSPMRSSGG